MSDKFVTEDVLRDIWALNPSGSYEETRIAMNISISTNGYGIGLIDGEPITGSLIYRKYKAYVNYWKQTHGKKDPKYVPKDQQLKSIKDFCYAKEYNKHFTIFRTSRDNYLFRDLSDAKIKELGEKTI